MIYLPLSDEPDTIARTPVVSVVMAVHNGEKYLAEAVESILNQTFTDLEFLIIDDGSTDGSAAILSTYARQDGRIRLVPQTNQGLTKSLNTGIQLARGEFVARFDADDISRPQRFERQLRALRLDPSLVAVGCVVELITDEGLCLGTHGNPVSHDEIRKRLLLGDGSALTHPAVMIRKSALSAVGGYDETFPTVQDLDLFLRLSEVGRVTNLPDKLLLWRQHESSINRTRTNLWLPMKRHAIEKTIKRIGAAEYAKQFFYESENIWAVNDPLALGAIAQRNGYYLSAAKLYSRAMSKPGLRIEAIRRLLVLSVKSGKRFLQPYLIARFLRSLIQHRTTRR